MGLGYLMTIWLPSMDVIHRGSGKNLSLSDYETPKLDLRYRKILHVTSKSKFYKNMAKKFLEIFGHDIFLNQFNLPNKKEAMDKINKKVKEKKLRTDMLRFVKNNRCKIYITDWWLQRRLDRIED